MEIRLSRHDPRTHRFAVVRAPHPDVDQLLESRSMLLHDLAHYALESAEGVPDAFYGLLAGGWDPDVLREERVGDPAVWASLMEVEARVVRLQSAHRRGSAPDDEAGRLLGRVTGAWAKVGMGDVLVLGWPDPWVEVRPG